jgi:hypothetical protein
MGKNWNILNNINSKGVFTYDNCILRRKKAFEQIKDIKFEIITNSKV